MKQEQPEQREDGGVPSAEEVEAHMQRARAVSRLLRGPIASDDLVILMLPKLVQQSPTAAAHAAAAARLQQAEAAAQAAALQAASLAAQAGLQYRPPDGVAIDVVGIAMVRTQGAGGAMLFNAAPRCC